MSGADLEALRARFADGRRWFHDSPLYRELAETVSRDEGLLALAALARVGQQPTNLLMGALHLAVLTEPQDAFARFFPTVAGGQASQPAGAGAELPGFVARHREALAETLRHRLVQTNEPARATALRLALHEVARRVDGPVTFLEVGASAGIQLRFDAWAVQTGGRRVGPADAPLVVHTEWRGHAPVPDLAAIPPIAERLGVDLEPVDARDPTQRRWLQALVWPEHVDRFAQLGVALRTVAEDPPEILRGDAIELLPELDRTRLSAVRPLVVFHSQVRLHVPLERRATFDAAITDLGTRRRLLHIALEHRDDGPAALSLADSEGPAVDLARAHGHGRWIAPAGG